MHNYLIQKSNNTTLNVLADGFSQHGDSLTFYRFIGDNSDGFSPTYNVFWMKSDDVDLVRIDESIEI